ncbi:MAG: leucine-rich repeat domain-containing protein [Coprobacillus sp.]|nr:leucine-rich repeat domain-containing protein [Coprobacillus sp.]
MKKTKLLTSIAALALVVGLGACETGDIIIEVGDVNIGGDSSDSADTEPGETTPSEPSEDEETTSSSSTEPTEPPEITYTYYIEVENAEELKSLTYDGAKETQTGVTLSIYLISVPSEGQTTKEPATAANVTLSNYDEQVISINGLTVTPVGEGNTSITITWPEHDVTTSVDAIVSDVTVTYSYSIEVENRDALLSLTYDGAKESQETLELSIYLVSTPSTGLESKEKASASDVELSGYDQDVISINDLVVTPVKGGSTTITITWDDKATDTVTVAVEDITQPTTEDKATIYEADERYHIYPDGTIEVHQVEYDVESGTSETGHCVVCEASSLYTNMMSFTANGDGTCTMTSFTSTSATTVYVPMTYNGMTVTGVGDDSKSSGSTGVGFYGRTSLTFVGLPNTITEIQKYAFGDCTNLVTVNLPEGLTSIANRGFYNCQNLELPTFPSTLTTIGNEVFYQCHKFIEVTVPDTVTSLGSDVFQSCTGLVTAHISENIESVGAELFRGCTALTSVNLPAMETIPEGYLYGCSIIEPSGIEFPTTVSVTAVGKSAFRDCKAITSLDFLPDTITSFGDYAFQNVPITEIDFTKLPNLTSFGSYALGGTSLVNVDFPETVTELGTWLFSSCTTLVECSLPSGLTEIPQRLFSGCTALTTVTIPSSVTTVASYAFYNCNNLTTVYFDGDKDEWNAIISSATTSGNNSPLLNITPTYTGEYQPGEDEEDEYDATVYTDDERYHIYPDGTIEVHQVEFDSGTQETGHCVVCGATGLRTDRIDYAVSSDSESAYVSKMNSTSYTDFYIVQTYSGLPVTGIGDPTIDAESNASAFKGNTTIKFIGVPNTVTDINNYAFDGCTALTTINIPEGVTYIGKRGFYNCQNLDGITLPDGLTQINNEAFRGCCTLSSIDSLPSSVTTLGEYAFYDCRAITTFTLPENIELGSGGYQFGGCSALEEINLPTSLTVIPQYFLTNCTSLKSYTIPSSVTELKDRVFQGCSGLTSVEIPSSVTTLGGYEFYDCSALESITIPDSVTSIGNATCQNCTSLVSAVLGSGISSIPANTFNGCTSLTTITIPETITSIANANAFTNCNALTTVYYGGTAEQWATLSANISPLNTITPIYYNGSGEEVGEEEGPTSGEGSASIYSEDTRYHIYENGYVEVHQVVYDDGTTETGHCTVCEATNLKTDRINYTLVDETSYTASSIQSGTSSSEFYIVSEIYGIPVTGLGTPGAATSSSGFNPNASNLTFLGLPTSINTVYSYAFYNCSNLKTLDFAQDLTVYDRAFYGCSLLEGEIHIAEGQTSIDAYTFNKAKALTEITIPDTVTSIGSDAFVDCASLKSFYMPDSVVSISSDGFSGCTSLESIRFSENTDFTSLPGSICKNCSSLKSVTIPDNITSLGTYAFQNCTSLEEAYIGRGITSIGTYTFSGCTALKEVTLYNSVASVAASAFNNCSSLAVINYYGSAEEWANLLTNVVETNNSYFTAITPNYLS